MLSVLRQLVDGDTINLQNTPDFSIRADVCDEDKVNSLEFELNGNTIQKENIQPFSIAGDNSSSYTPWNPGVGTYSLKAIPYSSGNSGSTKGVTLSISLVIVDQSGPPAPDCHGDPGGSAFIDDCGVCAGGNTGITPNADKDSCGVCFGDGSSCQPAGGGPCTGNEVTGLSLMDASNASVLRQLVDGDTINLQNTPDFSIRADVCNEDKVNSLEFELNGNTIQKENIQPFSIAGDNSSSYTPWNPGVGTYSLKAIPYSSGNSGGTKGVTLSISLVIVDQSGPPAPDCHGDPGGSAFIDDCGVCASGNTGITPNADKDSCGVCFGDGSSCVSSGGCNGNEVTGLTLMHAGTSGALSPLTDGDTIDLATTPDFSIRADVCDDEDVASVEFYLNGNSIQMENLKPFAIAGDQGGDFTAWQPGKGSHTVVAVPYSGSNGSGQKGIPINIDIEIVDSGSQPQSDCHGDPGGSAFIDDCGVCAGGNTGITPNADKDSCGVCFGDGSSCSTGGSGNSGCTNFPGGRIAIVSDGNVGDQDDWGATAFAIAMLHYAGLENQLVFVGHSCIWKNKNLSWEEEMDTSSYGTLMRFGMDTSIVHSFRRDITASVNALTNAINASSANNPLWIYGGGPMDAIYRAIDNAQSSRRSFVKIISHSSWNENSTYGGLSYNWSDIKGDFKSDGVSFHQIKDQNHSNGNDDFRAEDESYWNWMYNSNEPDWQWLRGRNCDACLGDFDISDAGMMYWLITGGPNGGCEDCGTSETQQLFSNPCTNNSARVAQGQDGRHAAIKAGKSSIGGTNSAKSASELSVSAPTFTAYPNPSEGRFTAVLPAHVNTEVECVLYNQVGMLVFQKRENPNGREIRFEQTEGIKRGIYLLEVRVGDTKYQTKLVIE
ncbi:MAG: T9SS type A sorting domain-containing protein [Owenweeksia sp.]|nr:T9SS type A sorting domain-containing protein [Owenweeksia sp.]